MHTLGRFFFVVLLALALSSAAPAVLAEMVTLSGPDPVIYNLIGTISVTGGSGATVTVDVARRGTDGSKLTLNQNASRLIVFFPGNSFVYKPLGLASSSSFQVNDDGTFGKGGGDRKVTVRGMGMGLEAFADLKVVLPRGKTLTLYLGLGKIEIQNAEGELKLNTLAGDVYAEGFRGPLSGHTGSGDISLSRVDGEVELNTGSGDLTISGFNGSGEFNTGSGDISVSQAKGKSLKIQTGSGDISLGDGGMEKMVLRAGSGDVEVEDRASTELLIETGSGDISAILGRPDPNIQVRAGSGDVNLVFTSGLDAQIEASAGSGEIDVDIPTSQTREREHEFQGIAGGGKGRVNAETGSGDISLSISRTSAEKAP